MTEKKSKSESKETGTGKASENASKADVAAEVQPAKTSQAPEENKPKPAQAPEKNTGAGRRWVLIVIAFVVAGVLGGGFYWGWQSLSKQQAGLDVFADSLQQQQQRLIGLQQQLQQTEKSRAAEKVQNDQVLADLTRRLQSHGKRLIALSSTSREDWLLAETEYLLRLANQRLLMERGTLGAQALLVAADNILRDLDDVDLFPVRRAITSDLNALKLAGQVDREGLYLQLAALAEQLQALTPIMAPTLPARDTATAVDQSTGTAADRSGDQPSVASIWATVKQSLQRTLTRFEDFLRVRHHDEPVSPLLTVEHQFYLSQNLRLMIERAQLAMLREDTRIYQHSLEQAQSWLTTYYALNDQAKFLQAELDSLKQQPVAQELPSIAGSLSELKAYIERLHKLTPAPDKQAARTRAPDAEEA